jgi:(2Fe-2S) ferredoxin
MSADSTHPLATKRLVIGHLTICKGCCCGNTENGRPPVPVDWLKKEWRARGLLKRVQLTISGCLGPCDLPNVVTISNENGTQWFGEVTQFEQYRSLVDWATRSRDAGNCCPSQRSFTGTPCIPSVSSIQAVGVEFSHFKYRFTRSMSSSVASACSVVGLRLGSTT